MQAIKEDDRTMVGRFVSQMPPRTLDELWSRDNPTLDKIQCAVEDLTKEYVANHSKIAAAQLNALGHFDEIIDILIDYREAAFMVGVEYALKHHQALLSVAPSPADAD